MRFVYPAGLWALLCVGLLLAAHGVRRRRREETAPSAYLWQLSERFRLSMEPRRRLRRALILLVQALCVVLAALLIAQPLVGLPGARTTRVAVIDASASMRIRNADGTSRFERACRAVEADASALPLGSRVTVVLAGDEASVCAKDVRPGDALSRVLDGLECGWGEGDLSGAAALCDALLARGEASQVCLYTDRDIAQAGGMTVAVMRDDGDWNVSLSPLSMERTGQGMRLGAQVCSLGRDADVTLSLLVDGVTPDAGRLQISVDGEAREGLWLHCEKDTVHELSILVSGMSPQSNAVLTADADDGLPEDNQALGFGRPLGTTRVLLTGESTYFLRQALSAFDEVSLETAQESGDAVPDGYDLYVYDGCLPAGEPRCGAMWLIDPPELPENTGIVLGGTLRGAAISPAADSQASGFAGMTRGLGFAQAGAARIREVVSCGRFAPVLLCGELPLMLAGRMDSGAAEIVLACDVQETNLPLMADFIVLLSRMLACSVPPVLEAQAYPCGTLAQVTANGSTLYLQSPDLSIDEVTQETAQRFSQPGGYSMIERLRDGREKLFDFAVHVPVDESRDAGEPLGLSVREADADALAEAERSFPAARGLAAALLLLLMVEWVVDERERV